MNFITFAELLSTSKDISYEDVRKEANARDIKNHMTTISEFTASEIIDILKEVHPERFI